MAILLQIQIEAEAGEDAVESAVAVEIDEVEAERFGAPYGEEFQAAEKGSLLTGMRQKMMSDPSVPENLDDFRRVIRTPVVGQD